MRVTNRELRRRIRKILLKENKEVVGSFTSQDFNSIVYDNVNFYLKTEDTSGAKLKSAIVKAVSGMDKGFIGNFMENFAVFNYYKNEPAALNLNDVLVKEHGFTGADSPGADVIIGNKLAGRITSKNIGDDPDNPLMKNTMVITTPLLSVKSSVAKNIGYEAGSDAALQMALQAYDAVKGSGTDLNDLSALQNAFYNDASVERIEVPFGLIFGAWRRVGEPRLELKLNGTGVERSTEDFVSARKEVIEATGFIGELQTAGESLIDLSYRDGADATFYKAAELIESTIKPTPLYYFHDTPINGDSLLALAIGDRPGTPYPQRGSTSAPGEAKKVIGNAYAKLVLNTLSEYFKHNRIPANKVVFGGSRQNPDRTKLGFKTIEYIIDNDSDTLKKYFKQAFSGRSTIIYDPNNSRIKNGFPAFSDDELDTVYDVLFDKTTKPAVENIFKIRTDARFKEGSYKITVLPSFVGDVGSEQMTSPYQESPHFQILYADPIQNILVVEKGTTVASGAPMIKMSFGGQNWTYTGSRSNPALPFNFTRTRGSAASISNAASNYKITDTRQKLYIGPTSNDPLVGLDDNQAIERDVYITLNIDQTELERLNTLIMKNIQKPQEMSAQDLGQLERVGKIDFDLPDIQNKVSRSIEYRQRLNQLKKAGDSYKSALDEGSPLFESILQFAELVQHAEQIFALDPNNTTKLADIRISFPGFDEEAKTEIAKGIADTINQNANDRSFKIKLIGIKTHIPDFVKILVRAHLDEKIKILLEFTDLSDTQVAILDVIIIGLETYMMAIVMKHINDIATIKNENSAVIFDRVDTDINKLINYNFMTESRIYENILKKILYTAKKRR